MASLSPSEFAALYATDLASTKAAFENIASRKVKVLSVSGKYGAGKDSIAPAVLEQFGFKESSHNFFAYDLKAEVASVMSLITDASNPQQAAVEIALSQRVPKDQASVIVNRVWSEVKAGADTASKATAFRFALQFWGTEVRRTQDPNYWVKKTIKPIIEALALGETVRVTDARFENEVDCITRLNGDTVYLKVSPEVQDQRILARDNILPSAETRYHASETSLDRYVALQRFDVIVDTDELSKDEVTSIVVRSLKDKESRK